MKKHVVKITEGIGLEIFISKNLIVKTRIIEGELHEKVDSAILKKFIPYVRGERDIDIDLSSLSFRGYPKKVVNVYRTLKSLAPPGKTITYSELARAVKKHPRFIGYSMKINRFPLIVPCHRVVSKNGLGGFSYGIEMKIKLLSLERELFMK